MAEELILKRLDSFEEKLDKVSEAMVHLVRVEERQIQTTQALDRVWKAIEAHNERLAELERTAAQTFTRQFLWAIIVCLVGVMGYLLDI